MMYRLIAFLLTFGSGGIAVSAAADSIAAVTPDTLRTYATLHSLGFEWDISGDENLDATCRVRYRKTGAATWLPALDLLRVDFQGFFGSFTADRRYNMVAGSILFLDPGTAYEVELVLQDPDGGRQRRLVELKTRPQPQLAAGPVLFVHSGDKSGDGTLEDPLSWQVARSQAAPGDIYCLLPGRYGQASLTRAGEPAARIAWLGPEAGARLAGVALPEQGKAVFERLEVAASNLWIEGLDFEWNSAWPDSITRGALRGAGRARNVVVRANHFADYAYSIWLDPGDADWIITDNTIVGRKDIEQEGSAAFSGEGIELQKTSGHTVAYNAITQVADGVSYPYRNCDIFGNDIYDTSDDGIEPDYGYANIRIWGNRIANIHYHAFSFQGMSSGPWYFVRNQVTTARGAIYKFRVTDRFVAVNNTFVAPSLGRDVVHHHLFSLSRNNLFVRDGVDEDPYPWRARRKYQGKSVELRYFNPDPTAADWRTDWDYTGYDLRDESGESAELIWFDDRFANVEAFAAATGLESHSRHLDRHAVFAEYNSPTHPSRNPRPLLLLRPGGAAVDAGAPVANLADRFFGAAPDLGAHELGGSQAHYGPRPVGARR